MSSTMIRMLFGNVLDKRRKLLIEASDDVCFITDISGPVSGDYCRTGVAFKCSAHHSPLAFLNTI